MKKISVYLAIPMMLISLQSSAQEIVQTGSPSAQAQQAQNDAIKAIEHDILNYPTILTHPQKNLIVNFQLIDGKESCFSQVESDTIFGSCWAAVMVQFTDGSTTTVSASGHSNQEGINKSFLGFALNQLTGGGAAAVTNAIAEKAQKLVAQAVLRERLSTLVRQNRARIEAGTQKSN